MEKLYCEYCGDLLCDACNCLHELAERQAQIIEDYENSPETHLGWANEDAIYNWRNER